MRTLVLLVSFSAPCFAAEPDVTPVPPPAAPAWAEMKVPAGEIVVLQAKPSSEWDADPAPYVFEGGKYAAFLLQKGETRRVVVTGPDKAKTRLVLVAGEPGPKPPEPKLDPLKARLKAAYDADPAEPAKKQGQAKDLAELYRQAAALALRDDVASSGELLRRVRDAAGTLVGADALKSVRTEVAAELKAVLPADAALADEQRKAVADLFRKLAAVLDSLGG